MKKYILGAVLSIVILISPAGAHIARAGEGTATAPINLNEHPYTNESYDTGGSVIKSEVVPGVYALAAAKRERICGGCANNGNGEHSIKNAPNGLYHGLTPEGEKNYFKLTIEKPQKEIKISMGLPWDDDGPTVSCTPNDSSSAYGATEWYYNAMDIVIKKDQVPDLGTALPILDKIDKLGYKMLNTVLNNGCYMQLNGGHGYSYFGRAHPDCVNGVGSICSNEKGFSLGSYGYYDKRNTGAQIADCTSNHANEVAGVVGSEPFLIHPDKDTWYSPGSSLAGSIHWLSMYDVEPGTYYIMSYYARRIHPADAGDKKCGSKAAWNFAVTLSDGSYTGVSGGENDKYFSVATDKDTNGYSYNQDFGSVKIGESVTRKFTYSFTLGLSDLAIILTKLDMRAGYGYFEDRLASTLGVDGVKTEDGFKYQNNTCYGLSNTLGNSGTCTADVVFTPTSVGVKKAYLAWQYKNNMYNYIRIYGSQLLTGTGSNTATVDVNTPTVTLPTATVTSSTGAALRATVALNGSTITHRGFCYGPAANPTGTTGTCVLEGGTTEGAFTKEITGLTAGTNYYYRGYATSGGTKYYSTDGTFITSAGVTTNSTPAPDLTVGSITPTSVTVGIEATFSATVTNSGGSSTDGGFSNRFQYAGTSNPNARDIVNMTTSYDDISGTGVSSALAAGASATITLGRTIGYAHSASSNPVYIRACADRGSVITESNSSGTAEGNNCGQWTLVTSTAPATCTSSEVRLDDGVTCATCTGGCSRNGAGQPLSCNNGKANPPNCNSDTAAASAAKSSSNTKSCTRCSNIYKYSEATFQTTGKVENGTCSSNVNPDSGSTVTYKEEEDCSCTIGNDMSKSSGKCKTSTTGSKAKQLASVSSAVDSLTNKKPVVVAEETIDSVGLKYAWNRDLQIGSPYVEDIKALQMALTKAHVYSGEITGGFHNQTYIAVKKFQQKYGIKESGYVGMQTRAKLNSLYSN